MSVIKVLIMLFIKKQQFYAAEWLVMKIFLRGVIVQKDLKNIHKLKYQGSSVFIPRL